MIYNYDAFQKIEGRISGSFKFLGTQGNAYSAV